MNHTTPPFPRYGKKSTFKPVNMSKFYFSHEEIQLLQRQALDIFTECSNAGLSFRDSLTAILISGMDWGIQCTKETRDIDQ